MKLTLTPDELNACYGELHEANAAFKGHYPADSSERQPVHTVYGGANLFKAGFAGKLGEVALKTLDTYAPNYHVFARVLGLPGSETLPSNPVEIDSLTRALESNPEQVREIKQAAGWRSPSITGWSRSCGPSPSRTTASTSRTATAIGRTTRRMATPSPQRTRSPRG
jgi:hypothetical protein